MMKVGWLADPGNADGTPGGAELTAEEFRRAAPKDVEVVDCPPGDVKLGLGRYVFHNIVRYEAAELDGTELAKWTKYCHDVYPHGDPELKARILNKARLIFTSPLHRDRMGLDGEVIPPPIDLDKFRSNGKDRDGAVTIGVFQNPGKGQQLLKEWSDEHGLVKVYGTGAFIPIGANLQYEGALAYAVVPRALKRASTFVHLPTDLEPFGRAVVEAWAAGCELVVNRNVGALDIIRSDPGAIETAAESFWNVVLDA